MDNYYLSFINHGFQYSYRHNINHKTIEYKWFTKGEGNGLVPINRKGLQRMLLPIRKESVLIAGPRISNAIGKHFSVPGPKIMKNHVLFGL